MKETSKILRQLTKASTDKAEQYLSIVHKGTRRSLCLQAIKRKYQKILDWEFERGLKKIKLGDNIPIKQNGVVIGWT